MPLASRSPARIGVALVNNGLVLTIVPRRRITGFPGRRRMPLLLSLVGILKEKKHLLKVINL
jgi:hypothetical protein